MREMAKDFWPGKQKTFVKKDFPKFLCVLSSTSDYIYIYTGIEPTVLYKRRFLRPGGERKGDERERESTKQNNIK